MRKKQKTMEELLEEALVPEEEQPYEVPGNWIWVYSKFLLDFIGGGTPPKGYNKYWDGDIPWATVKDIKGRYLVTTRDKITVAGLENSSTTMAYENELLLITRMSPGKSTITKISTAINQDLKIVRPKIQIQPYFLWLFFTVNRTLIESMSTGTTVKGIQVEKLKKIPFPVPPLKEQIRIAAKVERLLEPLPKCCIS
ncbi:restriction endonuclease subunit S [Caldifermentibacillus hisashii]|uniref:restriction endonuclease subunit S n=1 Tax=Caldifermentibacillus hisashii TaxID=996558 RepID=UPI0031B6CE0F